MKMHADEIHTDTVLVKRLLETQFPEWANLPVTPVTSSGTDNAIYRLGERLSLRLPRIHWAVGQVEKELEWLPRLAPNLPLRLPRPLALGQPGEGYPYTWGVYEWLEGQSASFEALNDPHRAAVDLASFIRQLQRLSTAGIPLIAGSGSRGAPLQTRDAATRAAIAAMGDLIDARAALIAWEAALEAPDWDREPVWFHGDLLSGNVLVDGGQVQAVIDFSALGIGDLACDLMIAWSLFRAQSRDTFREALQVDEATWRRGKGHALSQAVIFVPYYLNTNPAGVASARRNIAEVLMDQKG